MRLWLIFCCFSLICQSISPVILQAQNGSPATAEPPTIVVSTATVPAATVPATTAPVATLTPMPTPDAETLVQQEIDQQIEAFLQTMSPEDRVGQLFVIAFDGNTISATSDITELIHDYRIGGVMIMPSRENFTNAKGIKTPEEIARLTNQLQALAYGYLLPEENALALTNIETNIAGVATFTETVTQTVTSPLGLVTLPSPVRPEALLTENNPQPTATVDRALPVVPMVKIPLLIGAEQLGDGYPATAMRRNFTPIPSQLALGSTWNPALVQAVGAVVGKELHAVGVNLLLGPSLDVTDMPRTDPVGALGVHTFGGDPYWVSKLGSAYIAGVHEGSKYQLAAIARHFPGQGDIDRLPDQEVATVQQTLADLRRIALPPFIQVTRKPSRVITPTGDSSAVDGLMTSHMRFSAFQGTSSSRIPPISLMPDLSIVLDQEGFTNWHNNGGILMTNALGVPAIRRYYEAPLQEFPYRRVALDAFVAGHDLIYLAHLSADDFWETEKEYIKDIIQFFRERYTSDPDFQAQVDIAVRRILHLKYQLYHNNKDLFTGTYPTLVTETAESAKQSLVPLSEVLIRSERLAIFEEASEHHQQAMATVGQVAREAMSVLYPNLANLSDVIPSAPQEDDKVLIFSDSRLFYECADCTAETTLGPEEIKSIITRRYGSDPGATGQIIPDQVYGRSFVELATLLAETSNGGTSNGGTSNGATAAQTTFAPLVQAAPLTTTTSITASGGLTALRESRPITSITAVAPANNTLSVAGTPISGEQDDRLQEGAAAVLSPNERLQQLINESNWIIFAMLDVNPTLNPGSDVVKQFLRQQSERLGNKKVIVLALNAPYFLDATEISKLTAYFGVYSKTQPFLESAVRALFRSYTPTGAPAVSVPGTRFGDLSQTLSPDPNYLLPLEVALAETPIEFPPNNNATAPIINIGTVIRLRVEQVLDHNGHLVPDGVPVNFHLVYENPEMTIPIEPVLTRNGSAVREVVLEQAGRLLISASAGDATTADPLILRVQDPIAEATANAVTVNAVTANAESVPRVEQTVTMTNALLPTTTVIIENTDGGPPPLPSAALATKQATLETLIIALLTIMVTLSLLLILQIRILPRSMLVHNMLWAMIAGLSAYILFALGVLPGTTFLLNTLRIWSAAVVVFIGMLLPLLWLQLRAE